MIRTLGLDLGPNSIGWALIEEGADAEKSRIVDMGVRVFPEGVDAFFPKASTRLIPAKRSPRPKTDASNGACDVKPNGEPGGNDSWLTHWSRQDFGQVIPFRKLPNWKRIPTNFAIAH